MATKKGPVPPGSDKTKRRRGAQRGNQNAKRVGLYARVADAELRKLLEIASRSGGLEEEVALCRARLLRAVRGGVIASPRAQESLERALTILRQMTEGLARCREAEARIEQMRAGTKDDAGAIHVTVAAYPVGEPEVPPEK